MNAQLSDLTDQELLKLKFVLDARPAEVIPIVDFFGLEVDAELERRKLKRATKSALETEPDKPTSH